MIYIKLNLSSFTQDIHKNEGRQGKLKEGHVWKDPECGVWRDGSAELEPPAGPDTGRTNKTLMVVG